MIPEGAIVSGFISKVINDLVDVSKDKIKKADSDRKTENQSFETRVYQVIIDAINEFTYNQYKNQDLLYDAAEKMLNGFKNGEKNNIVAVKFGLSGFITNVDDIECERFIRVLCHEISKENNFDVYKEIVLMNQGQEIEFNHDILQRMDKKIDHLSEDITEKNKNVKGNDNLQNSSIKQKVKSRTQEYLDKWNANMFLNDFSEWDENAGVNVKLKDVYIEAHLPHFIWRDNKNVSTNLKTLLSQHVENKDGNKMLLILGQPGIGKSTLITWITANFTNATDDILVYQFASDLKNIEWQDTNDRYDLVDDILAKINLSYNGLEGKTVIIDGFDEISVGSRVEIINKLFWRLIKKGTIHNFSLIITCRSNYIQELDRVACNYIILQPWNEGQIESFCAVYRVMAYDNVDISENTMSNILKNSAILGIPLILYMVLALNISIEKEGSIVDVYDQIFSLNEGGIYERCIRNSSYEIPHRISDVKEQIHQISKKIAIWIFENEPEKECIKKSEYEEICDNVMQENEEVKQDFLIGNFFMLVRHCEEIETKELHFIHRSIYEYFVAETIYSAMEKPMIELSDGSQEKLASDIAIYLKRGQITNTIGEYLQFKILKLYSRLENEKKKRFYQWWETIVGKMISYGMFYYTGGNVRDYKNIIVKETQCFLNLLEILRLLIDVSEREYIMEDYEDRLYEKYIKHCLIELEEISKKGKIYLNLSRLSLRKVNLAGMRLSMVNLSRANLSGKYLSGTTLEGANLRGASLKGTILRKSDLSGVILIGADLNDVDLGGAILKGVILDEEQIEYLKGKYDIHETKVYIEKKRKIINYEEYCKGK